MYTSSLLFFPSLKFPTLPSCPVPSCHAPFILPSPCHHLLSSTSFPFPSNFGCMFVVFYFPIRFTFCFWGVTGIRAECEFAEACGVTNTPRIDNGRVGGLFLASGCFITWLDETCPLPLFPSPPLPRLFRKLLNYSSEQKGPPIVVSQSYYWTVNTRSHPYTYLSAQNLILLFSTAVRTILRDFHHCKITINCFWECRKPQHQRLLIQYINV